MNAAFGLILARSWMNLCGLLSFLVVARFVTPAEIGLYALASSVTFLPMLLVGAGYAEHVISRDPERRDTATAFWSSVAVGVCGMLYCLAAAFVTDALFDQPRLAWMIAVMAPLPAIWSVAVVPEATLIRDGRGRPLAAVPLAADTLAMAVLVVVLLLGDGVMALIANRLVGVSVALCGLLLAAPLPPGLRRFDIAAAKRIGLFSVSVIGSRMASWANQYGTELVIAIGLPTTAVGHFRMASRLSSALFSIIWQGPSSAQLAYFGRSTVAPQKAYLRALRLHLSLAAPILIGAAMASPVLINVLLGPNWEPSALVFSMLCLAALPSIGSGIASLTLTARGRSHRAFMIDTAIALTTVAAMMAGAQLGLDATAMAKLLVACLFLYVTVTAVRELGTAGLRQAIGVYGSVLTAGAALALAMAAVFALWPAPATAFPSLLRVSVAGLLGLAAYAAVTLLVLRRTRLLLQVLLRKRWKGRRRSPRIRGWRFGNLSP